MIQECPSRAHGFLPTIKLELLFKGCKNFDIVSLPKSVILPSGLFSLGSGSPITSKEFLMAWDSASNKTYLFASSFDT